MKASDVLKGVYTAAMCADAQDARIGLQTIVERLGDLSLDTFPAVLRRYMAFRRLINKFEAEAPQVTAEPAYYSTCQTERTVLVKTQPLSKVGTDEGIEVVGWKTGACDTPLFSDVERSSGVCRACAIGWEHPENYTTAKGRPEVETQNEPYIPVAAEPVQPQAPAAEFIECPFTINEGLYKRNSDMRETEELSVRCHFCNRPIRPRGLQVHMTTDLELTTAEEVENSQGFFEVGPECAKKIPARFIFHNYIGSELSQPE
jgi:hypothetical protein